MDQTTLVTEQLDIGEKFLEVVEKYLPVAGATWIFRQDFTSWWLYIVSPYLQPETYRDAQMKLVLAQREFRKQWIDSCHLKVIGLQDPVAEQSSKVRERHPDEKVIPYPGTYFGKLGVENVYIYGNAALPSHVGAS